jgi:hypothetical protein
MYTKLTIYLEYFLGVRAERWGDLRGGDAGRGTASARQRLACDNMSGIPHCS